MERVHIDITCLACGSRSSATYDCDSPLILGPMLIRSRSKRSFSGANTACISIALDHCGDCPTQSTTTEHE